MVKIFADQEQLSAQVVEEICQLLLQKPDMLFCIAAGHTSVGVFRGLAAACKAGKADFSHASFVAMDEWVGMSAQTPDSCGQLLVRELLSHINLPAENVRLFDGTVADPLAECQAVEAFIEARGGIDYLVLGCGMNGHLALNEPGTPFEQRAHLAQLDSLTAQVGQKYFQQQTSLTQGITLGIQNFGEARRSVLMVTGAHKANILQRILTEAISPELPATAVRGFVNASIYCDQPCAMQ